MGGKGTLLGGLEGRRDYFDHMYFTRVRVGDTNGSLRYQHGGLLSR